MRVRKSWFGWLPSDPFLKHSNHSLSAGLKGWCGVLCNLSCLLSFLSIVARSDCSYFFQQQYYGYVHGFNYFLSLLQLTSHCQKAVFKPKPHYFIECLKHQLRMFCNLPYLKLRCVFKCLLLFLSRFLTGLGPLVSVRLCF